MKNLNVPLRLTVQYSAFAALMMNFHLHANPTDGNVAAGSATITTIPGTVTVQQLSNTAVINWQSFSINSGELTQFIQPGSNSAVLNRVLGGSTSVIDGTLSANGHVFLLNGNGILIGADGTVNTAGFIASTRDLSDADFLAGNLHFVGTNAQGVQNLGKISALGGDVILIGHTVENEGTITASQGTVGLAAGDDVLISQVGSEHVFVNTVAHPSSGAGLTGVKNGGNISAVSAELKAANGNIYALAVNNTGLIRATGTGVIGGHLWLTSATGTVVNTGTLDASGSQAGALGGTIETSGAHVGIQGTVKAGSGGTWVIDPADVTIDTGGTGVAPDVDAATLLASLNGGTNVQIAVASEGTNDGIIDVNSALNWSSSAALTLSASSGINLNQAITATSGSLSATTSSGAIAVNAALSADTVSLTATSGAVTSTSTITAAQAINLTGASVTLGAAVHQTGAAAGNLTVTSTAGAINLNTGGTLNGYDVALSATGGAITTGATITGVDTVNLTSGTSLTINKAISQTTAGSGGITLSTPGTISLTGNLAGNLLTVNAGSGKTITDTGTVTVADFLLQSGNWTQAPIGPALPAFSATHDFEVSAGTGTSFIRSKGGDGSTANPYQITDVYGLEGIGTSATYLGKSYTLSNSINASGTATWNSGAGFVPIGGYSGVTGSFTGNLEGNGSAHAVTDLTINLPGTNNIGLFSQVSGSALLDNVVLSGASITGQNKVGGLVGLLTGSAVVLNSSVGLTTLGDGGTITGVSYVGGLIGQNTSTVAITNDYATANVTGGDHVGGLIGDNSDAVTSSDATGTVSATGNMVGGFIGNNTGALGLDFASGSVTSTGNQVGGLVGANAGAITLSNASGTGPTVTISGGNQVGGLVGYNSTSGSIATSYASSAVSGVQYVGGLVGENDHTVAQSYATSTASVSGNSSVGGLIGWNKSTSASSVSQSYAAGNVTANGTTAMYVGGLIGENDGGLTSIFLTGNVSQASGTTLTDAGGLVGYNNGASATIDAQSYATGTVSGTQNVGGLVGNNAGGSIGKGSYATGNVTGNVAVGGLIGYNSSGGGTKIDSSYAKGTVTASGGGAGDIGGLIGQNSVGTIVNSYALGQVNGTSAGADYVGGLVGENDALIQTSYASGAVDGLDFVGGLVGKNTGTINTQSYATGAVTGSSSVGGLVGQNTGIIGDAYTPATAPAIPPDLELLTKYIYASGTVTGNRETGGLVGENDGTVQQASYSGTVNGMGSDSSIGGLVGSNHGGTINYTFSSGTVNGNGVYYVGGLIGFNDNGTVTWSNSSATVTGDEYVGGFVGYNTGTSAISQSSATGTVTGVDYVGGFAGYNYTQSNITQDYSTANVSATGDFVGGLIGDNAGSASEDYSTGSVTASAGSNYVGGSLGLNDGYATASQLYATGAVTGGAAGTTGGLVGVNDNTVTGSYWDSDSTGQTTGIGSGSTSGATALTSNPGTTAFNEGSYTGFGAATTGLANADSSVYSFSTGGNVVWYMVNGLTRPFLWWEAPIYQPKVNGAYQISTPHQLQLMVVDLNANYAQAKTIDLSEVKANGSLWSSAGFAPVGYNETRPFTGSFTGAGYELDNLYIKTLNSEAGLFGVSTGSIGNVHLSNAQVTGGNQVGALIGWNQSTQAVTGINLDGTSTVTGTGQVGGLIGENGDGTTASKLVSSETGQGVTVTGNSQVGGLVGLNNTAATLQDDYSLAAVVGSGPTPISLGGLVGENEGTLLVTYATGNVTGGATSSSVGGLVGTEGGAISQSYAIGAVTGNTNVGGLIGVLHSTGVVQDVYATGAVTGTGSNVGGLLGDNFGTLNRGYATGAVSGTVGTEGELIGTNETGGTYMGLFWDSVVAGISAIGQGATASLITDLTGTTIDQATAATTTYAGFDSAGTGFLTGVDGSAIVYSTSGAFTQNDAGSGQVWRIISGSQFPQLTALSTQVSGVDDAPTNDVTKDGITPGTPLDGETVSFNSVGHQLATFTTIDGGNYAFLYPAHNVPLGTYAIGSTILIADAATHANSIAASIASSSGVPNFYQDTAPADLWANTVRVVSTGLNNQLLSQAGSPFISVPDTNAFGGTDILVSNGSTTPENFEVESGLTSPYTIDGNMTVDGNFTFDSSATVGNGYTNAVTLAAAKTTDNPTPIFSVVGTSGASPNVQLLSNNLGRSIIVETDGIFQNNSGAAGNAISTPQGTYTVYSNNPEGALDSNGNPVSYSDVDNGLTKLHYYGQSYSTFPPSGLIPGENYLVYTYQPTLVLTATLVQNGTGAPVEYGDMTGTTASPSVTLNYGESISSQGYSIGYTYTGLVNGDALTSAIPSGAMTPNIALSASPSVTTEYANGYSYAPVGTYDVTFINSSKPRSLIGYNIDYQSGSYSVQSQQAANSSTTVTIYVDGSQTFANGTSSSITTSSVVLDGSTTISSSDPNVATNKFKTTDYILENLTNTTNNSTTTSSGTTPITFGGSGNPSLTYADATKYYDAATTTNGNTGVIDPNTTALIQYIETNYGVTPNVVLDSTGYTVNKATVPGTLTTGSSIYGTTATLVDPINNTATSFYGDNGTSHTLAALGYTDGFTTMTTSANGGTTTGINKNTNAGTYTLNLTSPSDPTQSQTNTNIFSNYNTTPTTATYTVNKAPLTVTADSPSLVYDDNTYTGSGNAYTSSYTGFVNSDTSSLVTGTPVYSGASQTATNVGTYTITPAQGSPVTLGTTYNNYSFTYVNGTLTITPAPITVEVNANYNSGVTLNNSTNISTTTAGSVYGSAQTTAAGLVLKSGTTGVLYGTDSFSSLGLGDNLLSTVSDTTGVGTYGLSVTKGGNAKANNTTFTDGNYSVTTISGNWDVTPAPLTITANDQSKYYGIDLSLAAGTQFVPTGLKNGQTIGTVTLTVPHSLDPTLTTSPGTQDSPAAANHGSYAIVPTAATGGTFTAGNYTITYVNGTLTVNPETITVTALGGSSTYGDSQSAINADDLGISLTGGKLYDASGNVITDPTVKANFLSSLGLGDDGSSQISPTTGSGTYPIHVTGATSGSGTTTAGNLQVTGGYTSNLNYKVNTLNGIWNIGKTALYITANSFSKILGVNYIFSGTEYTSLGLKNGDVIVPFGTQGSTSLTSLGAPSPAGIGQYVINVSNAQIFRAGTNVTANYTTSPSEIYYIPGVLTVLPNYVPYRDDFNTFYQQSGFTGYNGDYPGGNLHRYYFFGTPGNIHRILPDNLKGIETGSSQVDIHIGTNDYFGYSKFMVFVP